MNSLALCMVVRDSANLLAACLQSVCRVVDEMIILDTGSADDTIAIAQNFGARVISISWMDDFARARNLALAEVRSDWVITLEADEQLDPAADREIPGLLKKDSIAGYHVTIRSYVLSLESGIWDRAAKSNDTQFTAAKCYPAYVEHEQIRLFRRQPEVYFVGRVYESVDKRLLETGQKLGRAQFCIHQFGLVADAQTRARKHHLYRRLGRQKVKEMPRDAQAHLELGLMELDDFGNPKEALALFERACELNPRSGVGWFFQGVALSKLRRFGEALKCLSQAERHGHCTSPAYEMQGDVYYNLKEYARACESYDRAVRQMKNPRVESKLGLAIARAGNAERGLDLIRQAVNAEPTVGESYDRLILVFVWLNRIAEAGSAAEAKLTAIEHPGVRDFLRAASLWAKIKNWPRAAAVLQSGLQIHPRDITLGRSMTELNNARDLGG
jgi:tetratricopeptide (TPR) repeat protein